MNQPDPTAIARALELAGAGEADAFHALCAEHQITTEDLAAHAQAEQQKAREEALAEFPRDEPNPAEDLRAAIRETHDASNLFPRRPTRPQGDKPA